MFNGQCLCAVLVTEDKMKRIEKYRNRTVKKITKTSKANNKKKQQEAVEIYNTKIKKRKK